MADEQQRRLLGHLPNFGTAPFDVDAWAAQTYSGLWGRVGTRTSWPEYVEASNDIAERTYAKGAGPAFMFATTQNLRRRSQDLEAAEVTAHIVDIDEGLPDFGPARAVLDYLKAQDCTYHAQWRRSDGTFKFHLVIPYAEPYSVRDPLAVRQARSRLTAALFPDHKTDPAVDKVAGVLFGMTRRPGAAAVVEQEWHLSGRAFDMVRWLAPDQQRPTIGHRRRSTPDDASPHTHAVLKHLDGVRWLDDKGAWDVVCPVQHDDDYDGKTYLYPSGHVSCMAGKCQGKPLAWFLGHLPTEAQAEIQSKATDLLRLALTDATPKIDIPTAHAQIDAALTATRPVEGHATVVQVSTGAGKTHAVTRYLDHYAAPFEDEAGLSAVMAVPTNALLREVDRRLTVEHKVRTGVLAVLQPDGSPACKKHAIARPLQQSGGNVHRLLCSHCEYREDCTARDQATTGQGSLVLTNHALMVSTAHEYQDRGRHPLLVWDESPPWVQTATVSVKDLDWLLDEFDTEASPIRNWTAALADVALFSSRYRNAVRPVLEALRWAKENHRGISDAKALLSQWIQIPLHQMMLVRACEAAQVPRTTDAWADFCASYTNAYRLNLVEMGFDTMREDTQRRVVRAEKLMSALGVLAGADAVLVVDRQTITLASLTPAAVLYRTHGGVVLDATANLSELRALRPDLSLVQCRVQDAGDVERYLIEVAGLDRKSLQHRPGRLNDVVEHARKAVTKWGRRSGRPPKVALFCYKSVVASVREQWPEAEVAYYGNVRGYDRFFQEGFDVFVTLGDPVSNLGSLAMQWRVLTGGSPGDDSDGWSAYVAASATSELAQAHGRARDPQAKLGLGGRLHLHYGRKAPTGWDLESTQIDTLTFAEGGLS